MAEIPPAKQNRPQVRGLYKVTLLCYRKPGMSEEDFHHHWTKIHSAKVSDFLRSHGVVGYTQYHTPSWVRREAREKLKALGSFTETNTVDYDGFVELRMHDLSCFENASRDPYYAEIVGPDETSFWDFERSSMTVGWEETYIDAADNGKVADSVVGKRGKDARLDS